jgi:hypothetical protein
MSYKYLILIVSIILFSGCSKYYATAPNAHQEFSTNEAVPVKVKLKQHDWSLVVHLPEKTLNQNMTDILFDNPIFFEDDTAKNTLNITIKHHNDHGGAEMANAVLTGSSLFLIPGIADSDVDINISMNGISSNYKGELVVAQGLGAASMIDKNKYKEDNAFNITKDLMRNAMDKFTKIYLSVINK